MLFAFKIILELLIFLNYCFLCDVIMKNVQIVVWEHFGIDWGPKNLIPRMLIDAFSNNQ